MELKSEIFISNKLRPYIVNTGKTIEMINKFEMMPPTKELFNNFELKFLKEKPTFAEKVQFDEIEAHKKAKAANVQKKVKGEDYDEPVEEVLADPMHKKRGQTGKQQT